MDRHEEILTNNYHLGQEKIWDGREVLNELICRHGRTNDPPPSVQHALNRIFTMILRGEEAAWKISLQLGNMLENVPARMAATAQAHDEARHFYVMQDYLRLHGASRVELPVAIDKALKMVLSTKCVAKKLVGMQLMIEPVALTIFQEIRRMRVDPILADLLAYFEKDEARHVALGVHALPQVIKDLSFTSLLGVLTWQTHLFMLELHGLKAMEDDFKTVGLNPHKLFFIAEKKQLAALEEIALHLGWHSAIWKPLQGLLRFQKKRIL